MRKLIALFALMAGCAAADGRSVIFHDGGGNVQDRIDMIQGLVANEVETEIAGVCLSSCTMHLYHACIYPYAVLGFHGPSVISNSTQYTDEELLAIIREGMASMYPKEIADWAMAGPLYSDTMVHLSGRRAIDMGAVECK